MALNPQTRGTFTNHILAALERRFLERLEADFHLVKHGKKKSLARRSGNTLKFNRYSNMTGTVTALTEGVTPTGLTLTDAQVTLTVAQYGQYVTLTDEFVLVSITDEAEEVTDLLAYDGAISLDSLTRNELDTNGTQTFADAANNSSKADVETGLDTLSSTDLRINLKAFKVANVPPFADGFYKGIIHPLMEFDLVAETAASSFMILAANTTRDHIETGFIGRAYGHNLFTSTNIRADSTSTKTYGNIFLGRDGYVTGDIETGGMRMLFKALGQAGSEDPLDQRQTLGWKAWYGVKVLEALRVNALWAYNAG